MFYEVVKKIEILNAFFGGEVVSRSSESSFLFLQRVCDTDVLRLVGECFAPSLAGLMPLEQPELQVVRSTFLPGENRKRGGSNRKAYVEA